MDNKQKEFTRSLSALGSGLSALSEIVKEYSENLGEAIETMGNAASAASGLYEGFKGLSGALGSWHAELSDSTAVKGFEKNVTSAVSKIGEDMALLSKGKEGIGDVFSEIADSAKTKFSKIGESVSAVVANIKNGFSAIPTSFEAAGNLLTSHAGSIGSKAGSLLSLGITGGIALAAAAVAGLTASFVYLMESNEEFGNRIKGAWSQVTEAFAPVEEAFIHLKETLFGEEDGEMTAFTDMILESAESIIDTISEAAELISELLTEIFDGLAELWTEHGEEIAETVTGMIEAVTEIISGIVDVVSGIIDVIAGFFTGDGNRISEGVQQMWDGVTEIFASAWDLIMEIFSVAVDFFAGIWKGIRNVFSVVSEWFGEKFTAAKESAAEAIEPLVSALSSIWKSVRKVFADVSGFFREKFSAAYSAVKNVFSGLTGFFSNLWAKIKKIFTNIGTSIGNGIAGAFKTVVNSVISFAQNTINGFIRAINGAIGMINKLPGVSIGTISTVSLPRLASGGLVDAGQLFVAREAGPELVGTFGVKTAVMNNSQIVEAVSRGVFEAVRAASGGEKGCTLHIVNKLDGREIGRQVVKYHNEVVRKTGVSPLMI